jgi:hypothetical protein
MPGTVIREKTARLPRTLPTDTGVFFLAGTAEKGRQDAPEFCRSMADFVRKVGSRQTTSLAYDMAEAFFQEGGSKLYFGRIFGPTPVRATANLNDAGAAVSLVAKAKSPGVWGNALNVGVVAGDQAGEFKIRVTHDTDTTIDYTSPSFVDQATAIQYFSTDDNIDLILGASALDPAVIAPVSLAGGTDDFANVSDATAATALALFSKDLGPGQVAYAGRTTSTAWSQLIAHGVLNNRVPLADPPDTTVKSTLIASGAAWKALANSRFGGLFGPWLELPGLVAGATGRPIPASAVVAGIIARNDGRGLSPNKPAAGDLGVVQYANKVRATFTEVDYEDLNNSNVNMIRSKSGDIKVYGFRSGADKTTDRVNWQLGNIRLYMAIAAKADNILERFVLREIDGRGLLFRELAGQLTAMLLEFGDSLYGEDPSDKFYVDTTSVNTPTTIANGEIHAALELTMSPMGETVILDITKRQITA